MICICWRRPIDVMMSAADVAHVGTGFFFETILTKNKNKVDKEVVVIFNGGYAVAYYSISRQ